MSAGPSTQAALIQGNQSTNGPDASQHTALFYLFQEVSKLASPIHSTFVDADSPCKRLKDASLQETFTLKKEEGERCSSEISDPSGSPHGASYNQTNVTHQSQDSRMSPEGHSPWKVLSLINLQCKRLLSHGDAEERDPLSSSSPLKTEHLSKATAKVTDQEVECDGSSSEFTFNDTSVFKYEREEITPCVSRVSSLQSQSTAKHETIFMEETVDDSSRFHHEEVKEDKFSRNRQSDGNREYLSSEEGTEHLTAENISKITKPTTHDRVTYSSNVEAVIFPMKPELTLDCNANLSLLTEATCDAHLQSLHITVPSSPSAAASHCILTEEGHPPVQRGDSHQESSGALSVHQKTLISNTQSESKAELGPRLKEVLAPPAAQLWRTKTPRKQPHPSRSVDIHDPDLQGVMFRMDPELDDSKEQCRLLITSEYRGCCSSLSTHRPGPLSKRMRKPRARMRAMQRSVTTSSSDEETTSVSKDKVCASCCTRKTPMWRNAEDGTPLCNACGIRYKKYRVRCVNCWHIPRKEGNSNSTCLKCGNFVRLTSAQLKHTT